MLAAECGNGLGRSNAVTTDRAIIPFWSDMMQYSVLDLLSCTVHLAVIKQSGSFALPPLTAAAAAWLTDYPVRYGVSDRRIRMIIPVPVPDEALEAFSAQAPAELTARGVRLEMTCAARGGGVLGSIYEGAIAEVFCIEAGASAEADGCAAVCVNSMSDSGVAALRSRLSIPVVGAAQPTYALAAQLGRRFSIISMWDQWRWLYDKILAENGLGGRLASVRSIGVRPDAGELLAGKEDSVFPLLLEAAHQAIEEDGADVLILGSTTMHQSHRYLAERLSVPVLNPGLVCLMTCDMLLEQGLSHSKRAYPKPDLVMDGVILGA